MSIELRTLLALPLSALLFSCGAGDADGAIESRTDELGNTVDASTPAEDAGVDDRSKHKAWAAALACVTPRVKDCADGQVAAIAKAVNQGEIEISKSVLDRLSTAAARVLANVLIEQHSKAQEDLMHVLQKNGITPIENANSKGLTETAQLIIDQLSKKSGPELDAAFATHQLLLHTQGLGTLDHVLLPSTENEALEEYLRATRKILVTHTVAAAKVQGELAGTCGGDGTLKPVPAADAGAPEADAGSPLDPGQAAPPPGPAVLDVDRNTH